MKHLNRLVLALVGILLVTDIVHADTAGDITTQGRAAFVAREGYNLVLGTEDNSDINFVQNNAVTFSVDGQTGAATFLNNLNLGNTKFLVSTDAAGTGTLNLIGADASDNTVIQSSASDELQLKLEDDAQRLVRFSASSDTALTQTFGDDGTTATQVFTLQPSTTDGDDDASIQLGFASGTRGAGITLPGEEVSGGSDITYNAGASDAHIFKVNGTNVSIIDSSGIAFSTTSAGLAYAPYIATPATNLTPVAGTNDFRRQTYIAPAGPTAQAIALPDSPSDGDVRTLVNMSANPLIVASLSTPKVNNGTNRTTSVAARGGLRCAYSSGLVTWVCEATGTLATPIGG